MRLQIESPSSVVNNDGRPIERFRGFMGLDQFDRGLTLRHTALATCVAQESALDPEGF